MKKKLWKQATVVAVAALAAFALLCTACKGQDTSSGSGGGDVVVESVTISGSANVKIGGEEQYTAIVIGENLSAADSKVDWTLVAGNYKPGTHIEADGTLYVDEDETAKTITVKATSKKDASVAKTKPVQVVDPDSVWTVIFKLDGGTIGGSGADVSILVPKGGIITAENRPVDPIKAGNTFGGWFAGDVQWNFNTVTVTDNITLVAAWNDEDDGTIKALTGFSISGAATMKRNATIKLATAFIPANATDKTVTYKSSNTGIATVAPDGTVMGLNVGRVTITATPGGDPDLVKTHTVTVTLGDNDNPPTSIALRLNSSSPVATSFIVQVGSTLSLDIVWGGDPSDYDFYWEPENAGTMSFEDKCMAMSYAFPYEDPNFGNPVLKGIGPTGSEPKRYTISSKLAPSVSATVDVTVTNKTGYTNVDVAGIKTASNQNDFLMWQSDYAGNRGYSPLVRNMMIQSPLNQFRFATADGKAATSGFVDVYSDPWQTALDKATAAGKAANVVIYFSRDLVAKPINTYPGTGMTHTYSVGAIENYVGIPSDVLPTQSVWRYEYPLKDFVLSEAYVGKDSGRYVPGYLEGTAADRNGDYFANTDAYFAKAEGGNNPIFSHWDLGRVTVNVPWQFAQGAKAALMYRVELEYPE
jgi:hypothetical protein